MSHLDAAIACHRRGDVAGARTAAHAGLAKRADDVPLLHFLGMLEQQAGDLARARSCLEQAVAVEPGGAPLVSLSRLYARLGEWRALSALAAAVPAGGLGDEYLSLRVRAMQETSDVDGLADALSVFAGRRPDDPAVALAAARALADAGRLDHAEAAYRRLLGARPTDVEALLGMTGLLESLGRSRELEVLFDAARAAGGDGAILSLGEAIERRERGEFAAALDAVERASALLPAATWQQMRGELADRAGDAEAAFEAFAQMNAADTALHPEAGEGVRRFRASLAQTRAALDRPIVAEVAGGRAAPLFLLGFPRSGTTLLDTFLMGHPAVEVHEERPFLEIAAALGADASVESLRAAYWNALDAEGKRRDGVHVDKYPLASARVLLIHRLFPDARLLFALRHPCDVVLSCFMTRFRLNWGVASFLSIEDTALTYTRVMDVWTVARERIGLDVLDVRYEELVGDPAAMIRRITDFVGLDAHEGMLDHRATARNRGLITTPSFAQVIEPVSARAVGRWKRYRPRLEPVLPLLAPWCERFGYSLDD